VDIYLIRLPILSQFLFVIQHYLKMSRAFEDKRKKGQTANHLALVSY